MKAAGSPEQAKKKRHKGLSQKQVIKYTALKASILWQAFLCFLSARGKALAGECCC